MFKGALCCWAFIKQSKSGRAGKEATRSENGFEYGVESGKKCRLILGNVVPREVLKKWKGFYYEMRTQKKKGNL